MLRTIKVQGWLSDITYKRLYPTVAVPPSSMVSPNFTNKAPLRPIVCSRSAVTYGVANELENIHRPLVGHSPITSGTPDILWSTIKSIKLEHGECILSYDVKALFTSVQVNPTISTIKHKLQKDPQLHSKTSMPIQHITILLEFCLKNTYLLFQGKYYELVYGAAMGSSISPIVSNLVMEEYESKAIRTAPNLLRLLLGQIS